MKLNQRLNTVSQLFTKYHNGRVLADIGTDHAYLPVYLSLNNEIDTAYACDISKGPLKLAKQTISKYHIKNVIPLLGSGITPVIQFTPSDISICGMGGILMSEILDEHLDFLKDKCLFLQANTANYELRKYLYEHHFQIIDEEMVEDMHHIYEAIVCKYTDEELSYSEKDFIFGPELLKKRGPVFEKKWQYECIIQQRILDALDENHEIYIKTMNYKKMIEGVLNDRK